MKTMQNGTFVAAGLLLALCGAAQAQTVLNRAVGPDVIVGDINGISVYNSGIGQTAFAVGTTSCNVGNGLLNWFAGTDTRHPVIAQNIYRFRTVGGVGKFEQVGQGFVKHGFTALAGNVCATCPPGSTSGDHLAVSCSDPYSSSLNGGQSGIGPRSEINVVTGAMTTYSSGNPTWPAAAAVGEDSAIHRRIKSLDADLQPNFQRPTNGTTTYQAAVPGLRYYSEGQYVTQDEVRGPINQTIGSTNYTWLPRENNASWREFRLALTTDGITYSTPTTGDVSGGAFVSTTRREQSAVYAWAEAESGVTIVPVDVPGDGRFYVAYKVTQANGVYNYEYVIQNATSHRSAQSFSIPASICTNIASIGFKDVNSHSGEGYKDVDNTAYSSTDWTGTRAASDVVWSTSTYAASPKANALRWGTMYNFRFTSTRPPTAGTGTIGLFRPATAGSPATSVAVAIAVPTPRYDSLDYNGDGNIDPSDVDAYFSILGEGPCIGGPACADLDFNNDGNIDPADVDSYFILLGEGCEP
jgi:hypothetical protein